MVNDFFETLMLMIKKSGSDGMGGTIDFWEDGTLFQGSITTDNRIESRIAEKNGVTALYTVTTSIPTILKYNDVIKNSKGDLFRIKSRPVDMTTPSISNMDFMQVQAELYLLS